MTDVAQGSANPSPRIPPGEPFASAPPKVELVHAFDDSFNNAVATARTCYSSRVITAFDVQKDEAARAQRDAIAKSTYEAGHHTTLQHAHFQFVLENVSRQFIWSFLHAHPFYNSEQVSQRYVAVKPDHMMVPRLPAKQQTLYETTARAQMRCYQELVELLMEPAAGEYFQVFPARQKHADKYRGALKKKAQEVARYALPVATFAHLYHTVSGLTLHRYNRLCNMLDVPLETRVVVRGMVEAVSARDPLFFRDLEDPLPLEETHEYQAMAALAPRRGAKSAERFVRDFDAALQGKTSRLADYKPNAEGMLAESVRVVLGASTDELSDDDAIARVLSPKQNPYLAGALNLSSLGKLMRSLVHPHFTFQKKLSHTADSQDQRHRMTPGARPILHTQYVGGEPDVVIPELLSRTPAALDRFMGTMRETWSAIDMLLDDGVAPDLVMYLLPNAFPVRFYESGDLSAFWHKWTTRLCYNAQEEIWRASLDEVREVRRVHPRIARYIEPPCGLRREAGLRPICPEGTRFCGVAVWKMTLDQYQRVI